MTFLPLRLGLSLGPAPSYRGAGLFEAQSPFDYPNQAEVLIVTGERTMLEYLLQPINDTFRTALREE